METEKQLLEAIHSGERAALRRLYDRYSGYAMAIALRYVPERDEVHDVMQDSFVRILTTIAQFDYRGEGSLKAWVARIVCNMAIDHLRASSRFMLTDNDGLGIRGDGGVEITDGGEILFQKAVEVLPDDTPEILQRRVMEEAEWVLLPKAVETVSQEIIKGKA